MARKQETQAKVRSKDIPRLLDQLACDDANEQAETLTLLCPCRNVRYDKEVWIAIFQTVQCTESPHVRDRAEHAIGTLKERAQTDPRSQELVRWLVEQGVAPESMAEAVPVWRPIPFVQINGLTVPRFERPSRSRKNRARR